jgi:hypothetical protein
MADAVQQYSVVQCLSHLYQVQPCQCFDMLQLPQWQRATLIVLYYDSSQLLELSYYEGIKLS